MAIGAASCGIAADSEDDQASWEDSDRWTASTTTEEKRSRPSFGPATRITVSEERLSCSGGRVGRLDDGSWVCVQQRYGGPGGYEIVDRWSVRGEPREADPIEAARILSGTYWCPWYGECDDGPDTRFDPRAGWSRQDEQTDRPFTSPTYSYPRQDQADEENFWGSGLNPPDPPFGTGTRTSPYPWGSRDQRWGATQGPSFGPPRDDRRSSSWPYGR